MKKKQRWSEEMWSRALELTHLQFKQIATTLNDEFGTNLTTKAVRSKFENMKVKKGQAIKVDPNVKLEIDKDGHQTSTIKVRMTLSQSKDPKFVLRAHGYNPELWEIEKLVSNTWDQNNKKTGMVQLYQSKIIVKPKTKLSIEEVIKYLQKDVEPVAINRVSSGERNLVINLTDVHMGIVDYDYMKPAQNQIINVIKNGYQTIAINLIGDLLHNDSLVNPTTTRGTLVDQVDMVKAIEDLKKYVEPLITEAVGYANEVRVYYIPGNHDLSISYMFTQYLVAKYGNEVIFDEELKHRKAYMLDNVLIGIAHGDLARKNLPMILATEFADLWGAAKTREYFVGHFHSEKTQVTTSVEDKDGVTVRQLSTLKKSDYYEIKNGYVGSRKKLQLFEYDSDCLRVTYDI